MCLTWACSCHHSRLSYRDSVTSMLQTAFTTFSYMKSVFFWFEVNRTLFPRVEFTMSHHWFRWWLGAWTGDTSLSEPVVSLVTDTYMPNLASANKAHWGRVTHICVDISTIIGPDNGLSPDRRQAIIWTNAEILLIGPLGKNFSEILTGIQTFSFKKMHLKMSSAKCRPFFLGLNVNTLRPRQNGRHFADDIHVTSWGLNLVPHNFFCSYFFVGGWELEILIEVTHHRTSRGQVVTIHIEAETKWPTFCRRHFQTYFRQWKCLNFD